MCMHEFAWMRECMAHRAERMGRGAEKWIWSELLVRAASLVFGLGLQFKITINFDHRPYPLLGLITKTCDNW